MKTSKLVARIQPSLTRRLFDLAKQYENVIDFTLGDPDYATPDAIRQAACDAILSGKTRYSANAGLPALREAAAAKIFGETGVRYDPESEIMISVGAMQGLFLALCALIDPGDEVVIPSPYWVNYKHMTELLNGIPVLAEADEAHGFVMTKEVLRHAVTDRTRVIILNSPNNPTGAVYGKEILREAAQIAVERDITVLWDECYKSILYDGAAFTSILEFPGMKEHAVVVNSCSKRYAMTGWRIGYLAAPSKLVSNLPKLQENMAACAPLPSQYAAIQALTGGDDDCEEMRRGYERRRNLLVGEINRIDGLSCVYPQGTFYALVNIKKTGLSSEQFAYELLRREQVAVVPGVTYGEACEGYVRMAYTMPAERLLEGTERIRRFVHTLKGDFYNA